MPAAQDGRGLIPADVNSALVTSPRLMARDELLARGAGVPDSPGLYAWYFRDLPSLVPLDRCVRHRGYALAYLGIAPSRASSSSTLRTRLRMHFRGNAGGSTLRLSLGCLLRDDLALSLLPTRSPRFGSGERVLSAWMAEHARVAWVVHPEPWHL
ncbi:MAG: hypothetical protein VKP57_12630, partial [Candidatus Sericytochromatia bacterium]|nr:hypothetical protein [Candidatus Sericytochromatia bacterium]